MDVSRPDKKIIEGLSVLSTSAISDAMDRFGLRAGCEGIFPITPGVKMAGPAFTLRYVPVGQVKGNVGDYMEIVNPGDVIVLDNNGRTDCTVWGDILTLVAKMKGIAGTVIDGVCRDIPFILKEKYPIFTRGRFMMTGKDRVMVEAMNVTVSIGKTQVKPGDILVGDDSGVVVVPWERAAEILELAEEIETAETQIETAVRGGLSLAEAREKYRYHTLQSRQ
ncbi:MAG: RraA family protein [Syntrophaceae bacterium]|nr:RraA family protein [Syntrophaceae bacterium]